MAMHRMMALFKRTPAAPRRGEVAGANIGTWLAPYIGELPLDPHLRAREAYSQTDETEALRIYRETLRDERCYPALEQRLNAAVSTPWEVEPASDAAVDVAAAEDLAGQLEHLRFSVICRQLLHAVWYGWSVGEAMWGRDGSRVVLKDLVVRSLDRFWWDPAGELLLRTWDRPQGTPVPPGKFVLVARPGEHSDLPYAPGLARWCYWPVWFRRHSLKFWAVALEKFGSPTAMGKYPKGAGEAEKDKLLNALTALATGAGLAIPEDQVVELLETSQRSGGDYDMFMRYIDSAITRVILGQTSTTDQGAWTGTAEVQMEIRDETIAADTRLLDEALNGTITRWLTAWNFPSAALPRIRHDADPPENLDRRAKREKIIYDTTGWRPTMAHVQNVYGGEWEERPGPATPPEPADAELAEGDGDADPSVTDVQTERLRRDAMPVTDAMLETIRQRVEAAESYDALEAELTRMLPDLDRDALTVLMGEAIMAAELAGRYEVIEDT